jgi:hypothetical protein
MGAVLHPWAAEVKVCQAGRIVALGMTADDGVHIWVPVLQRGTGAPHCARDKGVRSGAAGRPGDVDFEECPA